MDKEIWNISQCGDEMIKERIIHFIMNKHPKICGTFIYIISLILAWCCLFEDFLIPPVGVTMFFVCMGFVGLGLTITTRGYKK